MAVKKKKASTKNKVEAKSKTSSRGRAKSVEKNKAKTRASSKAGTRTKSAEPVRVVNKISPPRMGGSDDRRGNRGPRLVNPHSYMKAPGIRHDFNVGDKVEAFCDHEKGRERVRGWIAGIVVQVDNKMVAVQFRSNVYLTDGWMVPDRILWYSLTSEHIRSAGGSKRSAARKSEKAIPGY